MMKPEPKPVTFEQVLVLASRRRSFYKILSKDIHHGLKMVGWKMEKGEMERLENFLKTPMATYSNLTGDDMLNSISWLLSDELRGIEIDSDNVSLESYIPIPPGPGGDPVPAWIKIEVPTQF